MPKVSIERVAINFLGDRILFMVIILHNKIKERNRCIYKKYPSLGNIFGFELLLKIARTGEFGGARKEARALFDPLKAEERSDV